MLEGLEISEVYLSDIPFENSVLRFDAEYFKKNYLLKDKQRQRYNTMYLGMDYFITDGQHGYHEVDEGSDIRHLTAKNFKNWFADDNDADRLAKWVDDNNKRSSLKENDIVLTTRGTVGFCAIVKSEVLPANIDQDVARIAHLNDFTVNPQFLVTYLNSKYGQDWTNRNQTGMVQQGLALWRIRELPVPILSKNFQIKIKMIIEKAHTIKSRSNLFFHKAYIILVDNIGGQGFHPNNAPINVKGFKESFLSTGRFDAEFYQKKYDDYLHLLKSNSNGYSQLSQVCSLKDSNFNPSPNQNYNYIELSNIGNTGDITGCTEAVGQELPTRARRQVKAGDVIVSSIEGSLDSCALVTKEFDDALCSTGFYVVNSEHINSETLLVLFKSEPIQNILKQNCSGTILTAINKVEFQNIPIPLIDGDVQKQIKTRINKSFDLKKQAELLLETAKRAVEIAIEQDETAALDFINQNKV